MTPPLTLPALDGRYALGFLTALGTLRLLTTRAIPATLAWDSDTYRAVLTAPGHATIDDLVTTLTTLVTGIGSDAALPDTDPGFPPPSRTGRDPLRVPATELAAAARGWSRLRGAEQWFPAFVTDLVDDPTAPTMINPYVAPSGQQKFRTLFEKSLNLVRADPKTLLRQAFTGWIRVPGCTGEYFDHRVLYSAADAPDGTSRERGVPGATWLAVMALPALPVYSDGAHRTSPGWHRLPQTRRGKTTWRPILTWPLWHQPLDIDAVTVLLNHPALTPTRNNNDTLTIPTAPAHALGVFTVRAAVRRKIPGRTFDGVLAPHGDDGIPLT
ncbi:hypothetical protein NDR87_13730 [Nocardia sp. CDC159]|uniref:Uncharacterized protein n=1 Tax=Nocardia pulmonis TaxID=2951408 RepID=A0A9X2IW29_9NOCA|nr:MULTISPECIES: hypothetical protein [Nocardia]MCM6774517.1 hypothetical protein [Nocardia pulmonis]MCM6787417.1 hypothetical protein [Nocardia sp. CDC159]